MNAPFKMLALTAALAALAALAAPVAAADEDAPTVSDGVQATVDARVGSLPQADAGALEGVRAGLGRLKEKSALFGSASHGFGLPQCAPKDKLPELLEEARGFAAVAALLFDAEGDGHGLSEEERALLAEAQAGLAADVMQSPHAWSEEGEGSEAAFATDAEANALVTWSGPRLVAMASAPQTQCLTHDGVLALLLTASAEHRIAGWRELPAAAQRRLVRALQYGLARLRD